MRAKSSLKYFWDPRYIASSTQIFERVDKESSIVEKLLDLASGPGDLTFGDSPGDWKFSGTCLFC